MSHDSTKRNIGKHACQRCRKSKIRCIADTFDKYSRCRKCLDLGLDCEWKEISKTRNRQKTAPRVERLESELRAMSATVQKLSAKVENEPPGAKSESSAGAEHFQSSANDHESDHLHTAATLSTRDFEALQETQATESLPMYLIDASRRESLMHTFTTKLQPLYPIVGCLSLDQSNIQTHRPFTASAMITAACIVDEPDVFSYLHEATVRCIVHAIAVRGSKSLDLLQALLVVATWTDMPEDMSRTCLLQWSTIAYVMAIELGIISRASRSSQDMFNIELDLRRGSTEKLYIALAVTLCRSR